MILSGLPLKRTANSPHSINKSYCLSTCWALGNIHLHKVLKIIFLVFFFPVFLNPDSRLKLMCQTYCKDSRSCQQAMTSWRVRCKGLCHAELSVTSSQEAMMKANMSLCFLPWPSGFATVLTCRACDNFTCCSIFPIFGPL